MADSNATLINSYVIFIYMYSNFVPRVYKVLSVSRVFVSDGSFRHEYLIFWFNLFGDWCSIILNICYLTQITSYDSHIMWTVIKAVHTAVKRVILLTLIEQYNLHMRALHTLLQLTHWKKKMLVVLEPCYVGSLKEYHRPNYCRP